MKTAPLLLEIKENCLDDGPGIRSTIFLKGCPLSCIWCHNPESRKTQNELSFTAEKCVESCTTCIELCPQKALSRSALKFVDRSMCDACFACIEECPSTALSRVGSELDINTVVERVTRDRVFFENSGGGVTLSGGEPLMFPEFLAELLRRLKKEKLHTLIQTCGLFNFSLFEEKILPYTDMVFFDLKIFDEMKHREFCGAGNRQILSNFRLLNERAKNGNVALLPRIPLIPDITDTTENLSSLARFLRDSGAKRVQLMSYNPLWTDKTDKLGLKQEESLIGKKWQTEDFISSCKSIFIESGIDIVD